MSGQPASKVSKPSYSASELKFLLKKRKQEKKFQRDFEPQIDQQLQESYVPGPKDYDIVTNVIKDAYYSGSKTSMTDHMKAKSYEIYFVKKVQKHLEERRDRISNITNQSTFGSFSVPRLYTIRERSPENDVYYIEANLPPQFVYSYSLDRRMNLLRWSGQLKERPYRYRDQLTLERSISGMWTLNLHSELEVLTYIYDVLPFVRIFSNEYSLRSILQLNSGGMKLTGFQYIDRPELERASHIKPSSKCIPFEIEGILVCITVERLIQILDYYRNPYVVYPHGACDDVRKFILHLIWSEINGIGDDVISDNLSRHWEDIESLTRVPDPSTPEHAKVSSDYTDEEIVYYYLSCTQREEVRALTKMDDFRRNNIELAASLGLRSMIYRLKTESENREGMNEDLSEHFKEEDEAFKRFNLKYGKTYSREEIYDPFDVGDAEYEEDMFNMFDNEEEIEEYDLPYIGRTKIDQSDTVLETTFEEFNTFGNDRTEVARKVWDPGGESRPQDPSRVLPACGISQIQNE